MNPIRLILLIVTLTSSGLAAQGKANQKKGALSPDAARIEFAGYTTIAKENLLLLFDPQEKLTSPFLKVGQVWRGSILKSFDLKSESITLVQGGREILLRLRDSKVQEMTRKLNIARGTYTLLDETVVYSADAQLIMANGFLVSSSDGELVSDHEQKIVGGDLIVRMPNGTLEVSNGILTTKDGGQMRVKGDGIRIRIDPPQNANRPNKAPEPTTGAVTPRATEGTSK